MRGKLHREEATAAAAFEGSQEVRGTRKISSAGWVEQDVYECVLLTSSIICSIKWTDRMNPKRPTGRNSASHCGPFSREKSFGVEVSAVTRTVFFEFTYEGLRSVADTIPRDI